MKYTVGKFLNRILKDCEGKHYLFRGTTKSHKGVDKINSSLYRWARDEGIPFHEEYSPFNIEKEILESVKRHFADNVSNIEMLTDLQHYHGKTNLIDFSRNLYIALFFACDGEHKEEPGELIIVDPPKIGEKRQEVDHTKLQSSSDPFPIEPANTQTSQKRVAFQNSVFVYPPSGYINKNLCKIIRVPAYLKRPILGHLREIHNIHTGTIYNDMIGFIANEKNYETASVLFYRGLASDNKGKYKEAIDYYDRVIELNPNDARAYSNRGLAKSNLRQHREAIGDFNKAIELDPNDAIDYSNRGDVKGELGQHQKAIDDYDKAIELDSNNKEAYNNRGVTKNNLRQHQEAIADYDKAIELDQNYAKAYNNRGVAKIELRQHQEAITDFSKALELNPNYAATYYNRGNVKNELEQYQEAIADYDKAIESDPNYAEAYHNRGVTKIKLEQDQEAIADFNKAIELDPKYRGAYKLRGLVNRALGRTQEADEDFKMAAKLRGN